MARHRTRLAGMVGVTATATCTAHRGVVEASGQLLNAAALAQRVGWMSAIVRDMTRRLLDAHCRPSTLAALAAGVDAGGSTLPEHGWMALRRLGAVATAPDGVTVSDRVRRIAEEHAARLLRLAVHPRPAVARGRRDVAGEPG